MMLVFVFHCARFFGGGPWHLKDPGEESFVAAIYIGLLDLWIMPLFFLLSGVGSWYALRSRSGGRYLLDRAKRILIPLYGVGACLLLVPQAYFEAITNGGYSGTFWGSVRPYFMRAFTTAPSLDDPYIFSFFWGHLWFLQFLFLISLAILPQLLFLRSERGQRFLAKLAGWCGRRGGAFLLLIPLAVVRVALTHVFRGEEHSWAHLLYFATFFLIGYVVAADRRFTEGFKKVGWICLALGIVGFVTEGAFVYFLGYNYANLHHPGGEPFSLRYVLFNSVVAIASWSWIVSILSAGAQHLNARSRLIAYGNEAVLPFYILHQTVILCVGWFVIRWDVGVLPKFLAIAVVSFALIMVLYEGFVRRFNVMRFLFGMRPLKKRAPSSGRVAASK